MFQSKKWGYCGENCTATEEADDPPDVAEEDAEDYDGTILPTANDKINDCGGALAEGAITGGRNAKRGTYPFIAALGVKNPKNIGNLKVADLVCALPEQGHRWPLILFSCSFSESFAPLLRTLDKSRPGNISFVDSVFVNFKIIKKIIRKFGHD